MKRAASSGSFAVLMSLGLTSAAGGQSEPWPESAETLYNGDGFVTVGFHDDSGRLVKRTLSDDGEIYDRRFDGSGRPVKYVTRYPDGRVDVDDLYYGHAEDEVYSERAHVMIPGKAAFAIGRNLTQEEFNDFLARLPPPPRAPYAFLEPQHPWGYNFLEPQHPWEYNLREEVARTSFRLLHQEMVVESVRLDERWVQITDSHGGMRHDYTENLEEGNRHVGSFDASGRIAQVVANDEGDLIGVWYGDNLVALHHRLDGDQDAFWFELVDARTGRRLLDSRTLPTTAAQPRFSALGGLVESVDDELFGVVTDADGERYALLPLHEGPTWRTVLVAGTEESQLRSLVHYSDDRLRIGFLLNSYFNGDFWPDLVVEAPRHGSSAIQVVWPQGIALPSSTERISSP